MRVLGTILLIIGILMLAFNSIQYQTTKKVVDIGSIEVSKKENKQVNWSCYTGGFIALLGLGLLFVPAKKNQ